jgi:hypothetical protein
VLAEDAELGFGEGEVLVVEGIEKSAERGVYLMEYGRLSLRGRRDVAVSVSLLSF